MPKIKSEATYELFSTLNRFKANQALVRVKQRAQPSPQAMLGLLLFLSFLVAAVLTAWA